MRPEAENPPRPGLPNPADLAEVVLARPRTPLLPRELSEAEFGLFRQAGQRHEIAAGARIFRRGEPGRSMYVIEDGQVRLEFGDGLPDKLIGAREYFGELALFIGNHARSASACWLFS